MSPYSSMRDTNRPSRIWCDQNQRWESESYIEGSLIAMVISYGVLGILVYTFPSVWLLILGAMFIPIIVEGLYGLAYNEIYYARYPHMRAVYKKMNNELLEADEEKRKKQKQKKLEKKKNSLEERMRPH